MIYLCFFIKIEYFVLATSYFPLHTSIIAATAFHFRVRNENGCFHSAESPEQKIQFIFPLGKIGLACLRSGALFLSNERNKSPSPRQVSILLKLNLKTEIWTRLNIQCRDMAHMGGIEPPSPPWKVLSISLEHMCTQNGKVGN